MPLTHVPNNSVVISREEYDKLSSRSKELERIEAQTEIEKRRAFEAASFCGAPAVFETKDGLSAISRVDRSPPMIFERPVKRKISAELTEEVTDSVKNSDLLRLYKFKGYDHVREAFIYVEE